MPWQRWEHKHGQPPFVERQQLRQRHDTHPSRCNRRFLTGTRGVAVG